MLRHRVIPALLLDQERLVKTRSFRDPVYVGDPINAIRIFNEKEVDELLVVDIGASRHRRAPDFGLIAEFAAECFMPLCYGGGVRSVDDAGRLFSLGIEKVAVQTAALENPGLVPDIAAVFGSQSVVVSVDVKRDRHGRPELYSAAARRVHPTPWEDHLRAVVAAGAGEVLLGAVDRDGTMAGLDTQLISEAARAVSVPVIGVGGVGSLDDIRAGVEAGASAVAVGAFFVLYGPHRAVLITYPRYEELTRLLGSVRHG